MNGTMSAGFTVWFTGMSGAGKSTIAQALAARLRRLGLSPEVLDGPEVQQHLGVGKAQTKDERNAEARKLTWVARLVTRSGGIVLQSATESPYRETRDEARRQIGRFAEVFVECPIETLIARDRTGKYKRALAGELKNLVGISEPYEPPAHPEVIVDTSKSSVDEEVEHIVGQLVAQHLLDPAMAAMKTRPRVSARSKAAAQPRTAEGKPARPGTDRRPTLVKSAGKAKAGKLERPVKLHQRGHKSAAKQRSAARTARADRSRIAAGGKRKR